VRLRITIACAAVVALALLSQYAATWIAVGDTTERGTDFSTSYVAALLIREGHGAQLYDQQLEQQRHLALLPPGTHITLPFLTPATTAVLALPFTWLDLAAASRLMSVLQVLALLTAILIAIRAAPWPSTTPRGARAAVTLAALAGVPTLVLLLLAQLDGVCALGLAGAYAAWRRDRNFVAGLLLGITVLGVKPHLALGLAVFMLARRDWRALGGFMASACVVGLTALAVGGPSAITGFIAASTASLSSTPANQTIGLPGLVASWLGGTEAAVALDVVLIGVCLAACVRFGVRSRSTHHFELDLLGVTALSLALSPHLYVYDLVLLAPAFAWSMAIAARAERSAWPGRATLAGIAAWIVGNLVVQLDVGNAAMAPPGRVAPLALVAVAVVAWRTGTTTTGRSEVRPARAAAIAPRS